MNLDAAQSPGRSVAQSLREYARGVAGGLIFSLPLLYTMEVWWSGFIAESWRLAVYMLGAFALLLGYNRYAGLRRDASFTEVVIDSVEEMGLGLVISATALWMLERIAPDMAPSEIAGKIVVEAMVVAIGVSVGTAQLGGREDDAQDAGMGEMPAAPDPARAEAHFGGQVVLALCGAVLFAANVGPTEEIIVIATQISTWKLLGLALVSLASGGLILFYSDFMGARQFAPRNSIFTIVRGTLMTYAVALFASAMILWFFGRFSGSAPITCLAETIVLGVAATLGASAGRLLIQGS